MNDITDIATVPRRWRTRAGLPALVVYHKKMGHHCGYVCVPHDELEGLDYSHPVYSKIEVHGGLTFAGCFDEMMPLYDGLWYVGFDCGHLGDLPNPDSELGRLNLDLAREMGGEDSTFKTASYVVDQCERLAEQLMAIPRAIEMVEVIERYELPSPQPHAVSAEDIDVLDRLLGVNKTDIAWGAWLRVKAALGVEP